MSKPTLAEYLAEVKGRCEKAQRGPWKSYCIPRGQYPMYGVAQTTGDKLVVCDMSGIDAPEANTNHIAHSRTDVEALLKMVDLARGLSSHIDKVPDQFCLDCGADLEEMMEALVPEEKP